MSASAAQTDNATPACACMQFAWPDQLRRSRVQPICNNGRNTSHTRGNDRGLSEIRTFASKNAACFFLILRTSAGWLKFFTFLEARARCTYHNQELGFPRDNLVNVIRGCCVPPKKGLFLAVHNTHLRYLVKEREKWSFVFFE